MLEIDSLDVSRSSLPILWKISCRITEGEMVTLIGPNGAGKTTLVETLFGLNPAGHHYVNVAFHAANAALLFLLLYNLTGATWKSTIVAALFALHPLHVESVAWVAERKDVLSSLFGIMSLLYYACYARNGLIRDKALSLFFFLAGKSKRNGLADRLFCVRDLQRLEIYAEILLRRDRPAVKPQLV